MSAFHKAKDVNSPLSDENNSRFVIMNYFRELDRQGKLVDSQMEGRVVEQ
jgi:hypothetical protein